MKTCKVLYHEGCDVYCECFCGNINLTECNIHENNFYYCEACETAYETCQDCEQIVEFKNDSDIWKDNYYFRGMDMEFITLTVFRVISDYKNRVCELCGPLPDWDPCDMISNYVKHVDHPDIKLCV